MVAHDAIPQDGQIPAQLAVHRQGENGRRLSALSHSLYSLFLQQLAATSGEAGCGWLRLRPGVTAGVTPHPSYRAKCARYSLFPFGRRIAKWATTGKLMRDGPLLAKYANLFNVGHNNFEFELEFGQFDAEEADALVHTRIITGPAYAKVLWQLLDESLRQHEETFGPMPDAGPEEPGQP